MRPKQSHSETRTTDDVQAKTHGIRTDMLNCWRVGPRASEPLVHHGSGLVDALLPDQVVVLLRKRWRGDLAVLAPLAAFCAHNVSAIDVDCSVDLDWFWKVVPTRGDLVDDRGISNAEDNLAGGDDEEGVGAEFGIRTIELIPSPVGSRVATFVTLVDR